MSRQRKRYANGQPRGGKGIPSRKRRKDYHRMNVNFHGGDLALEKFIREGRFGYHR